MPRMGPDRYVNCAPMFWVPSAGPGPLTVEKCSALHSRLGARLWTPSNACTASIRSKISSRWMTAGPDQCCAEPSGPTSTPALTPRMCGSGPPTSTGGCLPVSAPHTASGPPPPAWSRFGRRPPSFAAEHTDEKIPVDGLDDDFDDATDEVEVDRSPASGLTTRRPWTTPRAPRPRSRKSPPWPPVNQSSKLPMPTPTPTPQRHRLTPVLGKPSRRRGGAEPRRARRR